MVKNLKNLPQDIYRVLEGKSLYDPSVVDRFGDSLKALMHSRLAKEEREPVLRMSNLGKPLRQLYYELNKYDGEKLQGKTLLKFAYGDLIEALVIVLAEAAGYEVKDLQREVEIDGVKGHIDLVLEGVLLDVKSCSPYSFSKFETGEVFTQDPFGYVQQLQGYSQALNLPAAWLAVDKVSGEICILELPKEVGNGFDAQERIKTVREAVKSKVLPDKCYPEEPEGKSGNYKLSVGCSYCSYKFECWKDSNGGRGLQVYKYSNGPKFLTAVVKEPRVDMQQSSWVSFPTKDKKESTN